MLLLVVNGNSYSGNSIKEPLAKYKDGQMWGKSQSGQRPTPSYMTVKPEELERRRQQ